MKVAFCIYNINSPGGIINHIECLAHGFKELGHSVSLYKFSYSKSRVAGRYSGKIPSNELLNTTEWEMGEFNVPVSQIKGWADPNQDIKIPYKGKDNLSRARELLSSHDLVIWEVPVPTKQIGNIGNLDWLSLYDIPSRQIAIIHDGNFRKAYPWINAIKSHLSGIACVHPCAYNSAEWIDIPRALIVNPQNTENINFQENWNKRYNGFISIQTFKAWKHAADIIRAIPYMGNYRKYMGGGGIEYSYMVATDNKVKKAYLINTKNDPDADPSIIGRKIFDYAIEHGMKWLGYISTRVRDIYLDKVKFLIDPSWSLNYSKMGDHFNRVIMDAAMRGTVPIARNLGISDNLEGNGVLFKPNQNYLMIPYDTTPKEFAKYVDSFMDLSPVTANQIRYNNFELLKKFDSKKVAQDYIDLSLRKPCGIFNKLETGILHPDLEKKSKWFMENYFGYNGTSDEFKKWFRENHIRYGIDISEDE